MELEPRYWIAPNKQESYRDMISNLLFTYVTNFLDVKPKLTRISVNMDLGPLNVVRGKMMLI
jgi:hypothetical protein